MDNAVKHIMNAMKKSQKILSVFFALVLLLGAASPAVYAKSESGLKFGDDGKFRIMHITDTHFTDCPFEEAIAFIEAALDDSNVDRFAHYLNRLAKNTQFIVITHRRGTMVCADRLYGITMQEKGVSTLVSVNLIEGDLTQ